MIPPRVCSRFSTGPGILPHQRNDPAAAPCSALRAERPYLATARIGSSRARPAARTPPRSTNCRPDPGTRSTTVRETSTSPGVAAWAMWALISVSGPPGDAGSHSPMCTPARSGMCERPATVVTEQPQRTARPGPSNDAASRRSPSSKVRPRQAATSRSKTRRRCSRSPARCVGPHREDGGEHVFAGRTRRRGSPGSARSRRGSRPAGRQTAGDRRRAVRRSVRSESATRGSALLRPSGSDRRCGAGRASAP